ncbi:MAG: hypothetical protein ABSG37_08300 [Candidatus Limnocylindrales bacterium]|jgi:hypothetical protein
MDDLTRHGIEGRNDWRSYHSASEGADPRYHNRPDCPDGRSIADKDMREGTAGRPLCDSCRGAQKPGR